MAVVEDDGGIAGGAAGTVQTDGFRLGHGEEAVGKMAAQVVLGGERQPAEVIASTDLLRAEVQAPEQPAVIGGLGRLGQGAPQDLELHGPQRVGGGGFKVGLPIGIHDVPEATKED